MNTTSKRAFVLTLLCAAAAPAIAGDPAHQALARHAGLTERKVAIVLGEPMSQLEQRYVYPGAKQRLERKIGREAVRRLQNGETVAIRIPPEADVGEVRPIAGR